MKKPGSEILGTGQIYYCPSLLLGLVTANAAVMVHLREQVSARFTGDDSILSYTGTATPETRLSCMRDSARNVCFTSPDVFASNAN